MTKSTKEIRDAAEQTYRWQKKIEYFNEQLDKADKEYISDMIRDHLADMEISPCSFSYEIHVNYEDDKE